MPDDMKRTCANCKTEISSHVLVVDNLDFHRKSCYCWFSGHKVEGDNKRPQPCKICEPSQKVKSKKPDKVSRTKHRGRSGRAVLVIS